jgi:hypothetical protein
MKRSANAVRAGALLLAGMGMPANAAEHSPVVVELFTSQGCSSCPPANANLIRLSKQKNVLTLSFAVTYWDYLGWKDTYSKEEFTDRQTTYEPALGQEGPFTPQMVVNGKISAVGNDLRQMQRLIADADPLTGAAVALHGTHAEIGSASSVRKSTADVWLVRYDPNVVRVLVDRGENSGATLTHTHVVHTLTRLGKWNGKAEAFDFSAATGKLHTAILVQGENGGPIIAAATD